MVFIILALLGWSIHDVIYYAGVITIITKAWPFLPVLRKKIFGDQPHRVTETNFKKDVVYLFQFPGSPTTPSACPFSVKVEAFCRVHKIAYEKRSTFVPRGMNWQLPYAELNGETISDSQIIIRRLTEKLQIQAYPDAQTASIGHAIDRMLDNHTFNLIAHAQLDQLKALISSLKKSTNVPSFIIPMASFFGSKILRYKARCSIGVLDMMQSIQLETRVQTSIGAFTQEEYKELLRNDLLQLQTIIDKKKFILGDKPTAVDCTALGQIGVAYYAVPSARTNVHNLLDSEEFATLKSYLVRTKETIYGNRFCEV